MARRHILTMAGVASAALAGCDVAEITPADQVDSIDADATSEVAAEVGGEVVVPPPAHLERLVTTGDADDLYPDLAGDDLVWARLWLDTSAPGATAETDCLTCPYCSGCRFDVMHKRLPDGPETLLHGSTTPHSAPRVGDGVVTWADASGNIAVHDLASGSTSTVVAAAWVGATPVPRDGRLWWLGYDPDAQQNALMSWTRATGILRAELHTWMNSLYWGFGSALGAIGERQPFVLGEDQVLWPSWSGTSIIMGWPYQGSAITTALEDPERDHVRVLILAGDTFITESYVRAVGCSTSDCELALMAHDAAGSRRLVPDARPSRYVPPVTDGERVAWVDRRGGPYTVYGLDASGVGERLSSEQAVIGALSNLAASEGRVVWSDRRNGHWQLVVRDW